MTRKKYYTMVWQYKQRREIYKANYRGIIPIYKTERYILLTRRISQWNKEIKRLDKRKEKINKLLKSVNSFFSVNIENRIFNKEHNLARKIYFKIGLESKICGSHLAIFIGRKPDNLAAMSRKSLIESYNLHPSNKETYYSFKKYYEN